MTGLSNSADAPREYGPDYVEEVPLDNGEIIRIRPVVPEDRERLLDGFQRFSAESRYLRFFTDKDRLNEAEIRYFTEVDGERHFALGIVRLDHRGHDAQGLGIGRFIRLVDEPDMAEPAVAIADDMHRHGLGRLLMERLIEAAKERGIRGFRCDFLTVNRGMPELLRSVCPSVEFRAQGPVTTAEFLLDQCLPRRLCNVEA